MKVDLPTPGTPEIPIRTAPPACGPSSASSSRASSRWSARVDSTKVMARETELRSPARTPAARSLTVGSSLGRRFAGLGVVRAALDLARQPRAERPGVGAADVGAVEVHRDTADRGVAAGLVAE